jgi:hypothetical protein
MEVQAAKRMTVNPSGVINATTPALFVSAGAGDG